jgi:hypothetical protein
LATTKQKVFLEAYLGEARGNATEAARIAGYADPNNDGWRVKKVPEIAEAIQNRLDELRMSADEVQALITEVARGDVGDFLGDGKYARLDLDRAREQGKTRLIKKLTFSKGSLEFEIYDRMDALKTLAKMHGLLVDRIKSDVKAEVDVTDANGAKAYLLALVEKVTPASAEGSDRGAD